MSRSSAIVAAANLIERAPYYLDTETTGLGGDAEIVEIAILDSNGNTVYESLIRPLRPIPREAAAIHGIDNSDVLNAPTWRDVHVEITEIIENRDVVIYNAQYDQRLLTQTAAMHGLSMPDYRAHCAMLIYAKYNGVWDDYRNGWKWQKLTNAARNCNLETANAHRASADARMTRDVLRYVATQSG